jgi:hypothetical protein
VDYLDFLRYVRNKGLESREIVFLLISLAVLVATVLTARKLRRAIRQQQPLTYQDFLAPVAGLLLTTLFFLLAYSGPRTRYLLREGAYRYTAARILKYSMQRGNHVFVYEYYVAGQRYQSSRECGPEDWRTWACPALGQRYYVQFSLAAPGVEQISQRPVPDSTRAIPPLGWASIP